MSPVSLYKPRRRLLPYLLSPRQYLDVTDVKRFTRYVLNTWKEFWENLPTTKDLKEIYHHVNCTQLKLQIKTIDQVSLPYPFSCLRSLFYELRIKTYDKESGRFGVKGVHILSIFSYSIPECSDDLIVVIVYTPSNFYRCRGREGYSRYRNVTPRRRGG